jgi:hypothetical protein
MSWWQSLGLPGAQFEKVNPRFPLEIELVPDLLKANIMLHEFSLDGKDIVCWTYQTEGCKQLGQKELLISLRKKPHETVADFPQEPLEFFKAVLQHAAQGETIKTGSISEFSESGFLSSRFRGAAYIQSQQLGDWFPPEDSLATILLTAEELAASQLAGLTRVLALLGRQDLHFPCPVWNDLSRETAVDAEMLALMSDSFIAQMPRLLVRDAGVSSSERVIDLNMPLSARHYFKQLEEMDPNSPLLILTDFDERSDSMLVWQAEKKIVPLAITAPGATGTRIAGSFFCIAPNQDTDRGMIIEDGFALSIKTDTWTALKQSLINGSPCYFSHDEEGYDFRLSWHQDEETEPSPNTIEIDVLNPTCGSIRRAGTASGALSKPGCSSDGSTAASETEKSTVPAYAREITLLTKEADIKELVDSEALHRYISHVEDVVRDHFFCMGEQEGFDLRLDCTILPDRKAQFQTASTPIMEADDESDLLDRLSLTYSPLIGRAEIKFQLFLAVWGGSPGEIQQTQD